MELGPQSHNKNGLLGSISVILVYVGPLSKPIDESPNPKILPPPTTRK